MGIEPIANSLSPVESVGLTLLEDLIWAGKRGILRPSCAQVFPSPKNLRDKTKPRSRPAWAQFRAVSFAYLSEWGTTISASVRSQVEQYAVLGSTPRSSARILGVLDP